MPPKVTMAIEIINNIDRVTPEQYAQMVEDEAIRQIKQEYAQRKLLAITDKHTREFLKELRNDGSNGFSKDRMYRRIASIPPEVATDLTAIYGQEIWSNKKLLKNALIKYNKGEGQAWLTVNPNTI